MSILLNKCKCLQQRLHSVLILPGLASNMNLIIVSTISSLNPFACENPVDPCNISLLLVSLYV